MNYLIRRKEIRKAKEKSRYRRILVTLVISFIAVFFNLMINWWNCIREIPSEKVYFSENFNDSMDRWESLDGKLINENNEDSSEKYVKLSVNKYFAPHLKHEMAENETPPDSFVFKFKVRVSNFTGEAITLGTLSFATQPIVIVANQDRQVGIAHDMFTNPIYSNNLKGRLKKDEWQDVYVMVDGRKQTLTVYINNSKAISESFKDITYPLKQIWLGTIWVKGGGNYGAPMDVSFDDVTIGNEGILYRPTLIQYISDFSSAIF